MNEFDRHWQKLTALARSAPDSRDATAPFGFATRTVARAASLPAYSPWGGLGQLALRGLMVAAACGVAAVVLNYSEITSDPSDLYSTGTTDSVVELLDIS
jgi:glucan phosphorylase